MSSRMIAQSAHNDAVAQALAMKRQAEEALRRLQAQLPDSLAERGQFTPPKGGKARQVLSLVKLDKRNPMKRDTFNTFTFGVDKAKRILAHLDEIRAFVAECGEESAE